MSLNTRLMGLDSLDAGQVIDLAMTCQYCPDPAPCTLHCVQRSDIPAVMRWISETGCAGFSLQRWHAAREAWAERQAAAAVCEAYN